MTTRRQEKRQSNLLIRLLLVVVFSGGYLALAVLGRGGIGALFAQPALIALTVVLVALCGTFTFILQKGNLPSSVDGFSGLNGYGTKAAQSGRIGFGLSSRPDQRARVRNGVARVTAWRIPAGSFLLIFPMS
jgi:hypothetical protein